MAISKTTYSFPNIWRPDSDNNVTPGNGQTAKQLGTGGVEVSAFKLHSGSGGAHVDLYDWVDDGSHTPPVNALKWDLDSGNPSPIDNQTFASPLYFKKGLFAVLTEGIGTNSVMDYAVIPSQV